MLIALEGIDGAGKSTVSSRLAAELNARGIRARTLNRDNVTFGDDVAASYMEKLRSLIWPPSEHDQDRMGTEFHLFLLAAWHCGLKRSIDRRTLSEHDVTILDGSLFRVVAKAHVRGALPLDWTASLFAEALRPDRVILLDVDPSTAWHRRRSFKPSEMGLWDGQQAEPPQKAYEVYQGRIREALLSMSSSRRWFVIGQRRDTTVDETVSIAADHLYSVMASALRATRSTGDGR